MPPLGIVPVKVTVPVPLQLAVILLIEKAAVVGVGVAVGVGVGLSFLAYTLLVPTKRIAATNTKLIFRNAFFI